MNDTDEILNLKKIINIQKNEMKLLGSALEKISLLEERIKHQELEKENKNVDIRYKNWVIENLQSEIDELKQQNRNISKSIIERYESSKSWRFTAPLRKLIEIWSRAIK